MQNNKEAPVSGAVDERGVDALAQFIRRIDGNNTMGAGALAEKICEWYAALQPAQTAQTAPTDAQIAAVWDAQRKYHGGEPCKVAHVEFARALLASQPTAAASDDLQAMRAAFHVSMLRCYPEKSHDEISAEIDRALLSHPAAQRDLTFEQIEDAFPEGGTGERDGAITVSAQWLHDFARNIRHLLICAEPAAQQSITSIDDMCAILKKLRIEPDEHTDCTILYRVTFEQARALYGQGRATAQPTPAPHVDDLAWFIRTVDGNNSMGAGMLAERICDWLSNPLSAPAAQQPITYTVDGEVMSPLEYIDYLHNKLAAQQPSETYSTAQRAEAWDAVVAALNAAKPDWMENNLSGMGAAVQAIKSATWQQPQQFAECYVCGRPMDGLSEDDCHCFHRRELAQLPSVPAIHKPTIEAAVNICREQSIRFAEGMNGKAAYGAVECEKAISALLRPAAQEADELRFNATRLRNVARLVGLENAVPEDDATLDGVRGSVLGMIAGALRNAAQEAEKSQAMPTSDLPTPEMCAELGRLAGIGVDAAHWLLTCVLAVAPKSILQEAAREQPAKGEK